MNFTDDLIPDCYMKQMMNSFSTLSQRLELKMNALTGINYPASRDTPNVITFQPFAYTNLIKTTTWLSVGMGHILKTAKDLNAVLCLNVLITTASLGPMCVIPSGTVQQVVMKLVVLTETDVITCSNAKELIRHVFTWETCVMDKEIVHLEMMKHCVR